MTSLLINSVVGAASGWLTGQAGKGSGFGQAGNAVAGLAGGNLGGWLPTVLGLITAGSGASITSVIGSAVGGSALTWILGMFNSKKA